MISTTPILPGATHGKNFKEILTDFPEYLPNTYLQYYLYAKESAEDMDPNYTRANMVMDGREKDMIEQAKLIRESGGKKGSKSESVQCFWRFYCGCGMFHCL